VPIPASIRTGVKYKQELLFVHRRTAAHEDCQLWITWEDEKSAALLTTAAEEACSAQASEAIE